MAVPAATLTGCLRLGADQGEGASSPVAVIESWYQALADLGPDAGVEGYTRSNRFCTTPPYLDRVRATYSQDASSSVSPDVTLVDTEIIEENVDKTTVDGTVLGPDVSESVISEVAAENAVVEARTESEASGRTSMTTFLTATENANWVVVDITG